VGLCFRPELNQPCHQRIAPHNNQHPVVLPNSFVVFCRVLFLVLPRRLQHVLTVANPDPDLKGAKIQKGDLQTQSWEDTHPSCLQVLLDLPSYKCSAEGAT